MTSEAAAVVARVGLVIGTLASRRRARRLRPALEFGDFRLEGDIEAGRARSSSTGRRRAAAGKCEEYRDFRQGLFLSDL